jgi:hypothetical protein
MWLIWAQLEPRPCLWQVDRVQSLSLSAISASDFDII